MCIRDRYKDLTPDFFASNAVYEFIVPATDNGFSFFSNSKKEFFIRCYPPKFFLIHRAMMRSINEDTLFLCGRVLEKKFLGPLY